MGKSRQAEKRFSDCVSGLIEQKTDLRGFGNLGGLEAIGGLEAMEVPGPFYNCPIP